MEVNSLIAPGVDAHDFEPTPSDIIAIRNAGVLVYTDPAFETWMEDALDAVGSDDLIVVKTADLEEHEAEDGDHDEHGHDDDEHAHEDEDEHEGDKDHDEHGHDDDDHAHEDKDGDHDEHGHDDDEHAHEDEDGDHDDHGHDDDEHGHDDDHDEDKDHDEHGHEDEDEHAHDHGDLDPHVWLNPIEAVEQVRAIEQAFASADAAGASTYSANANALIAEIEQLDSEIASALTNCTQDHIVVSHEAYGHLAERYGFEQLGLADLSGEFESTPQRIAAIIDEIRELGITHILQEPITDDQLAKTVADETGAEILELHPLEALTKAEADAGDDYFKVMRRNLESLKIALSCG